MTSHHPLSTSRRRFVQGAAGAAIAPFFIGRARAAEPEFTMRIATVAPPATPWARTLKIVKTRIEKESEGRIKVKAFLGGVKGGENETAEECKRGGIECWGGSMGALASAVPEVDCFELPYLFRSAKTADKILDEVVKEDLEALLWKRGYKLAFYSENGFRSIGSLTPIRSLADLKGRKMRSQPNAVHLDTWRALEASPVPIPVTEVLTSLQTGVVEGFDNTPLFTFAASWWVGIRSFTLTEHIYQPAAVVLSRKWFESLPAELQKVVVPPDAHDVSVKSRRGVRAIGPQLIQNFRDNRVEIIELPKSEIDKFASAAEKAHDAFAKRTTKEGKALLKKIKAAL